MKGRFSAKGRWRRQAPSSRAESCSRRGRGALTASFTHRSRRASSRKKSGSAADGALRRQTKFAIVATPRALTTLPRRPPLQRLAVCHPIHSVAPATRQRRRRPRSRVPAVSGLSLPAPLSSPPSAPPRPWRRRSAAWPSWPGTSTPATSRAAARPRPRRRRSTSPPCSACWTTITTRCARAPRSCCGRTSSFRALRRRRRDAAAPASSLSLVFSAPPHQRRLASTHHTHPRATHDAQHPATLNLPNTAQNPCSNPQNLQNSTHQPKTHPKNNPPTKQPGATTWTCATSASWRSPA